MEMNKCILTISENNFDKQFYVANGKIKGVLISLRKYSLEIRAHESFKWKIDTVNSKWVLSSHQIWLGRISTYKMFDSN